MMKNRAFQVKMVNDKQSKKATDISEEPFTTPEEITTLAEDFVTHTTETIQTAVITTLLVATGCKIAVILTKAVTR